MPTGADVLRAAQAAGAAERGDGHGEGPGAQPYEGDDHQGEVGGYPGEDHESETLSEDEELRPDGGEGADEQDLQGIYGRPQASSVQAGSAGRIGRNGPRQPAADTLSYSPSPPRKSPSASGSDKGSNRSSRKTSSNMVESGRHRPRGNLPPPPPFDGNVKKDVKCFKHWLQKVDSFIEIAKHIIGDEEIGLRLHAALEGDAAEYLEGIPAKTFGVPQGWKVLIQVLREKYDEKHMHKVGTAMKAFFKMQVDRSWTLTETMDQMDKAARLCKEAGLVLPDEIMTHFFFEHSGSSLERQANVLLRTGGDYDWKKVKKAVELLYPQTTVTSRHRDKGYGKGRTAHEVQGNWDESQSQQPEGAQQGQDPNMDLEDWLYYEDPVEKLADYDIPDYLPENLARELHEVYATHRENRARLAKAVKARGFYVSKGKGKKGKSKGKDGSKGAGKGPAKSKGKGGKARGGMSLEELKKVTTCGDCQELGHWKGDPQCKGPKKAHEAINVEPEEQDEYAEADDYSGYYDDPWAYYQWETPSVHETWVTSQGGDRDLPVPGAYVRQAWKEEKSEDYPELTKDEAYDVIKTVNKIKRKYGEGVYSDPKSKKSVEPAETGKPMDVFTVTALINHKVKERQQKEKAVHHAATAPEAVKDAFATLGIEPPSSSSSSVWD